MRVAGFKQKGIGLFGILLIGGLVLPASAHATANASGLRAAEHPDGITRMVIDLSQSINFTTRLAENPYRIIIDTESLAWIASQHLPRMVGPLSGVKYDEDSAGAHITLKLTHPADVKSAFIMPPRENAGWRLVVDVQNTTKQNFVAELHPAAPIPAPPPAPAALAAPPPAPPSPKPVEAVERPEPVRIKATSAAPSINAALPPPLPPVQPPQAAMPDQMETMAKPVAQPNDHRKDSKDKDYRQLIVIDPGHGGVDPGATGVSGIYEKYITFSMARELQQQLEKTGHYRVRLTRDRDIFIPLRDRTAIARQINADLFISLHADVVKDEDIRGLSVYTLSQNASDTEAQALADKENKSDLIAGIDLSHEPSDVTNILIDLAQRETMNRSAGFAGEIVEELGKDTPLLSNTHRFAGFAVLKSPDVPAVLIEMGYLSNPIDEKNLRQPEYRAKLAHAISRAVDRYFLQGQKAKRP